MNTITKFEKVNEQLSKERCTLATVEERYQDIAAKAKRIMRNSGYTNCDHFWNDVLSECAWVSLSCTAYGMNTARFIVKKIMARENTDSPTESGYVYLFRRVVHDPEWLLIKKEEKIEMFRSFPERYHDYLKRYLDGYENTLGPLSAHIKYRRKVPIANQKFKGIIKGGVGSYQQVYDAITAYRKSNPVSTWREIWLKIPNNNSNPAQMARNYRRHGWRKRNAEIRNKELNCAN